MTDTSTELDPSLTADVTGLEVFDAAALDPALMAATYQRNGALQIRGLLDAAEVSELREAFTEHMIQSQDGQDDGVPDGDPLKLWPRMIHPHRAEHAPGRLARSWMLQERVMGRVRDTVGPVWAAQSMFYFKPPGARGQAMHQDNLFLQSHPETCVAAWIAVDDCDVANGALAVVPGTHRYEIVCPGEADMTESFTSRQVAIPAHLSVEQTRMRAGDCLIFHGSLVHGSKPNTTTEEFRRSLIFHYIPQGSREVAQNYQPLLDQDGSEVQIEASEYGGVCGDGWTPSGHH